jgi:transposase
MRPPIFVRELTEGDRAALEAGLRSNSAFVLRRSQIVLSSSRGERAPAIAKALGCNDETVRGVIRTFNEHGLEVLERRSSRPHNLHSAFQAEGAERLKGLLHESPRKYGKETSVWTLELAAEVSFEQGLTAYRVSDETVRMALLRLGVRWQRAKDWITSPDPEYARKKTRVTD